MRLSLSHIADGEWRAMFMDDNARLAPRGFGVAATPWGAVQAAGASDELWLTTTAGERIVLAGGRIMVTWLVLLAGLAGLAGCSAHDAAQTGAVLQGFSQGVRGATPQYQAPRPAPPSTRTIILPDGRVVTCSTFATTTTCY
jgi:hypothetical protein